MAALFRADTFKLSGFPNQEEEDFFSQEGGVKHEAQLLHEVKGTRGAHVFSISRYSDSCSCDTM